MTKKIPTNYNELLVIDESKRELVSKESKDIIEICNDFLDQSQKPIKDLIEKLTNIKDNINPRIYKVDQYRIMIERIERHHESLKCDLQTLRIYSKSDLEKSLKESDN